MKLTSTFISLLACVSSIAAIAVPAAEAGAAVEWPETVTIGSRRTETNAQRFKRGLGPAPPVTRTHQLLPRLSPLPAAPASYSFSKCVSPGSGVVEVYYPNPAGPTNDDAVQQCAASNNAAATVHATISVAEFGGTFYCRGFTQASVSSATSQTCTTDNYAVYSVNSQK